MFEMLGESETLKLCCFHFPYHSTFVSFSAEKCTASDKKLGVEPGSEITSMYCCYVYAWISS